MAQFARARRVRRSASVPVGIGHPRWPSLQRVGYGLVLVVAFSMGLAATLTPAIGLAFLYAGRFLKLSCRVHPVIRLCGCCR
ncbi:MAG: hypothetical protein WKF84_26045 [Pyrinomonadaceae bacterium]